MAEYPVLDGAGATIIANEKDPAYDVDTNYPVLDGAGGEVVGRKYDERIDYGPNLVANGGFETDTTGWTAYNYQGHAVSLSVDNSRLKIENDETNGGVGAGYYSLTTEVGKTYRVLVDIELGNNASSKVMIRNVPTSGSIAETTMSADGQAEFTFTATATTTLLIVTINATSAALHTFADSARVQEVL